MAVVAAVVLVIIVVLVVSGGDDEGDGSEEPAAQATALSDPAPEDCIDAWNRKPDQIDLSRHMKVDHDIANAWVFYMGFDQEPTTDSAAGECMAIFPLTTGTDGLGVELGNVVQIVKGATGWLPYAEQPGIIPDRVEELNAEAVDRVNAAIADDGTISALPHS